MFERRTAPAAEEVGSAELAAAVGRLAGLSTRVDDAERVDRIRLLEQFKAAAAAAQVRMTAAFVSSQRQAQCAAGVPAERLGRGVAAQVALARRESPTRAARYTGWSQVLVSELPETFGALERGETTEWRAMIVARETIWLSRTDRAAVDAALAGRPGELGDREVENEAKKCAYRLDPHGFLARSRAAERDRRVTLRPAPDTMTRLTALLPAGQGVAAYAALSRAADTARASGDARGRGQVMADTLVERVTGQARADDVSVEISLVMTDRTLGTASHATDGPATQAHHGGAADEPAHLIGYGPVPAGVARDLARGTDAAGVWVRRLYTEAGSGRLAAMDARRRCFEGEVREAIVVRDQICRTPWCGAPIRHTDHALSVADGGETRAGNGQGLCEACNYAKDATGWVTEPGRGGSGESVIFTTPTGHTYTSRPPDLPGTSSTRSRTGQRTGPSPPAANEHAA